MQLSDLTGLLLLVYLLILLPWAAWRSAKLTRAARAATPPGGTPAFPPRAKIFISTLIVLGMTFWLAWATGRTFGYEIFSIEQLGAREIVAGLAALAASFGLRALSRAIRTEEERRKLPVYTLMPRTGAEWVLYVATAVAAGIAEEAAYRGVGMAVLTWATGSALFSATVLAIAFGLAHITQEWKSVGIVILMALLMHALVEYTGTLVIAMVVHAGYDIAAGVLGSREARRFESE